MKNLEQNNGKCPMCGGKKGKGTTTFTTDLGFGVVVVRKVQADLCQQCGEAWIKPETAKQLEKVVEDARSQHHQVEVLEMSAAS